MDAFIVIVFFGAVLASICWNIYNHTSHSKVNGNTLREDAIICDIQTENVGGRKYSTASIRTTVTFDDGFIYISHKTHAKLDAPFFTSGTISVDGLLIEEIKQDAIDAHDKAYLKQIDSNTIEHQGEPTTFLNEELFSPPYFDGLFQKLSYFREQGPHRYIDIILYATYKARICATMFISQSNLNDEMKHKVIDSYDRFQDLSLDGWLEKNASEFSNRSNIIDDRTDKYENALLSNDKNIGAMVLLARTFGWILDNGWELNSEGELTTIPNKTLDIKTLADEDYLDEKHAKIQDEIEIATYTYCQQELPALITFFVSDIAK